jgi:hypothetical protein
MAVRLVHQRSPRSRERGPVGSRMRACAAARPVSARAARWRAPAGCVGGPWGEEGGLGCHVLAAASR